MRVIVQSFLLMARPSPSEKPVVLITLLRTGKAHLKQLLKQQHDTKKKGTRPTGSTNCMASSLQSGARSMRRSLTAPHGLTEDMAAAALAAEHSNPWVEEGAEQRRADLRVSVDDWDANNSTSAPMWPIGAAGDGDHQRGDHAVVSSADSDMFRLHVRSLDVEDDASEGCELEVRTRTGKE